MRKQNARRNRFILMNGETKIGEAPSIREIGKLVGCTYQHVYKYINQDMTQFTYKKVTYTIIDKLSQ